MTIGVSRPLAAPIREHSRFWRIGPLVLVLGSAGTAHLLRAFHLTLSADRLLGLAATLAVAVLACRRRLWWTPVHTALAVFVSVEVLTTALNVATWPQGPKFVTIYVLGFCCYALAAQWTRGPEGHRRMTAAWIGVAVTLSVVGTVSATLANIYQIEFWGSGAAQLLFPGTDHARVLFAARATFNEWNLLSSFLLIPFTLALWLWRRDVRGQRGLVAALGAIVFGLVFGVTRAAWIAMAAIIALAWRLKRLGWRQVAALGLMAALAFTLQAVVVGTSPLISRVVDPVAMGHDQNLAGRLAINLATIRSWLERPLVGHGAGSINRLSVFLARGVKIHKVWTGNVELFVLHDSGLLGLAALVGLVIITWRRAVRAIRRGTGTETPSLAGPLFVAEGALCFAYQFTHGLWVMYPYVCLGFLTAATEEVSKRP